jgi:acyl-CoA thioesterase I
MKLRRTNFLIEVNAMANKITLTAIAIVMVFLVSPVVVLAMNNFRNNPNQVTSQSLPIKVACVGDSITEENTYPSDLQILLGSSYTVGNFGSSGSTVSLSTWKPYINQPEFQDAKDFNPSIVVIMLGTNDGHTWAQQFSETFGDDYSKLIASFQQLDSEPQIWVAASPPILSSSSDLSPQYFTDTIIPATEDLANRMNLPIIDVYEAFGNHPDYLTDGVHPSDEGAAVIANTVYDAIKSA